MRRISLPVFIPFFIFLALAVLLMQALIKPSPQVLPPPYDTAPTVTLPTLDGKIFAIGEFSGKPVIINFFAHWCTPCLVEHPLLMKLSKSVTIYGIAWKDRPDTLRRWLAKHGSPYKSIGLDNEGKALLAFGASGIPETFLLSPKGTIAFHFAGPLTEEIIHTEIEPLLNEWRHVP